MTAPARLLAPAALLTLLAMLAGCASGPPSAASRGSADAGRDGPGADPPANLLAVPDAEPRLESVRPGGPNKPYVVLGQSYTPLAGDPPLVERGLASWYGRKFHGRGTATGEAYDMYAMTAAHRTMPLPSYARVRNPANGREVVVRINDRGPFHSDRIIDLSYTAALKLGLLGGVATVEVERITYEAIRTGAWHVPAGGTALAGAAPASPADASADPIGDIALRSATLPVATAMAAPPAPIPPVIPPATSNASAAAAEPLPAEVGAPAQAAAKAAPGFWLQLGAFRRQSGAVDFRQRVAQEAGWLAPLMAIFDEQSLHRLQAGPYASRADAASAANRLRDSLQLMPAIVERR